MTQPPISENGSHKISRSNTVLKGWGQRHTQCLILFFSITMAYCIRSCMGVALVAMADHTLISNEIFNTTDESLKFNNRTSENSSSTYEDLPIPWGKILRHKGVWATVIAHTGQAWGQVIIYTQVPAYMDKIMGVNIKANGVLSALPFLGMWLANFVYSIISDWLIKKEILSVVHTRKLANSFGSILAGLGFITMCYVPKNIYVVEMVLVLTCTFKIATHMGFHVVNIDIAPNFAGNLMSISNFAANGFASFAPLLSGFILSDVTNVYLWRQVFYITAAQYFSSNLIFVIFGTADRAEWNDPPVENDSEEGEVHPMIVTPDSTDKTLQK